MGVSICLKLVCCNIFDKMADAETAKLPTVPETLLKKRKARTALRAKQIKAALLEKKKAKAKRATIFKRAEQYVKEYRRAEADELRLARDAQTWQLLRPLRSQTRHRHEDQGYQRTSPQSQKGLAIAATPSNQQRHLC